MKLPVDLMAVFVVTQKKYFHVRSYFKQGGSNSFLLENAENINDKFACPFVASPKSGVCWLAGVHICERQRQILYFSALSLFLSLLLSLGGADFESRGP